jgi:hypothetical protein
MKRDMELIRLMLLSFESDEELPEVGKYPLEERLYNLKLMSDAGLIEAHFIPETGVPKGVTILRLTWPGHDFLDSTRDSKIWKKALDHIVKPGASWTFSLLMEWLKQQAHQKVFGVPDSS